MPDTRAPNRKFTLRDLTWTWTPRSAREAGDAVVRNFYLHWFPSKVNKRSAATTYSFWLGTVSAFLFLLLTLTGVVLMFLYVPSVERAYGSVKDLEYAVSFGAFLRAVHRIAAHLMVAVVFLHMVRVFLTSAYKNGVMANQNRPLNWYLGLVLLLLTLLLSFTGYLLPWDQLAYWAITVGTNIARAVPLIGEELRFLLLGGHEINQNTLIRFYVLHCVFLPLILTLIFVWHMWRIHKDGGLASHDQTALQEKAEPAEPSPNKTYTLMGVSGGTTATVQSALVREDRHQVQTVPGLVRRLLAVGLLTMFVAGVLAVWLGAPLEEAANPQVTPNPAKAPWYFLWLQELVTITTVRIGAWTLNGALVGGVLIPGLLLLWAFLVPSLDRSGPSTVAVWFHSRRRLANTIFLLICLALVVLTVVATFMRGPFWDFYWPWQQWPSHPSRL
ncbi:MAG TPA: cytochrome b N-terminal domain-containing protein [Acidobacteriota bacterium]|nr:cytochrome b N-terminal domain-containing protein [Acidobacteriota bacterium]